MSMTASNHCPACTYDLTGLQYATSVLVSCPECGSLVRPGAAAAVPARRATSRLLLLMIAPMLVVTGACWVVSVLVPDAARGPLYLPLIWASSIIVPSIAAALLWPGAVALVITDPARPLPKPWRTALWPLAVATGVNLGALWFAGYVLRVGVVFS